MRRWLDFPETVRAFGRVAVPWDLVVDFWKTMFPQADNGDDYFDDFREFCRGSQGNRDINGHNSLFDLKLTYSTTPIWRVIIRLVSIQN